MFPFLPPFIFPEIYFDLFGAECLGRGILMESHFLLPQKAHFPGELQKLMVRHF
jgi:hypothetical protein